MKTKASLPLLFSVVLMDMVGFGFIIPLIPDYIKQFQADPALLGLLMAVYAGGQFIAAAALAAYGFTSSVFATALVLLPMSLASGIAGTLNRSLLSKSAPPETTGGTFGLSASIESLNRIIAPVIGAYAFTYLASWLPGVIAGTAVACAAAIARRKLIKEDCLAKDAAFACYGAE